MSLRSTLGRVCIAVLVVVISLALVYLRTSQKPEVSIEAVRREFGQKRYEEAAKLVQSILSQHPHDSKALLLAGEIASRQNDFDYALKCYQQVGEDGSEESAAGLFGAGEILLHRGRLLESESRFRRALGLRPGYVAAHFRLAYILDVTGRRWESMPHLLELIRSRQFTVENLLSLGDIERVIIQPELLEFGIKTVPDDPIAQLGLARLAMTQNRLSEARDLLSQALATRPDEVEAQACLGMLLLATRNETGFIDWNQQLSNEAERHPDIWVARAEFAQSRNELEIAARCLWEGVKRDPDHRLANYRLGQVLIALKDPDRATAFVDRADQLRRLSTVLEVLFQNRSDTASMYDAARLVESLGRIWESWAWSRVALATDNGLSWPHLIISHIEPHLDKNLPRTLPEWNPALKIDLSNYPLPAWGNSLRPAQKRSESADNDVVIHFSDEAANAGIDFEYFSRVDPEQPGTKIFEGTGGGVVAFDYDLDLWPDLYLTQGCRWPHEADRGEHLDRLFRNKGTDRAPDVTYESGLGDDRYSQGATAADFNNDGFQDLYIANIGQNRLYQNNGDGTFTDVSRTAGLHGDDWTTSCLMADLNGDSWPDIYDVNYCAGEKVFTLLCDRNGLQRTCSPRSFDAASDRIWLNGGDGTFRDVSESSGIHLPGGYGLGIVAGCFSGKNSLDLFVGNDGSPNFFFVNQTNEPNDLKFAERGIVSGLAFNGSGLVQASMGIAVADVDGNGLCDLLVTNFFREASTLYLQQTDSFFADTSRSSGLYEPSFGTLGFGAQFLDGDLDGRPDLVVTNGHIDVMDDAPFKMSPQFFRNVGNGRFVESTPASLGTFFQGAYLGRGLARLDWNRDGKEDFAVTHIGSQAALLVNRTEGAGHYLALRFCGVASSRDAIGTIIHTTVDGRKMTSQLTTGDGYQACNERRIVIGLGESKRVDQLTVRWLSGTEEVFTNVAADTELLLIEGHNVLIPLPIVSDRQGGRAAEFSN